MIHMHQVHGSRWCAWVLVLGLSVLLTAFSAGIGNASDEGNENGYFYYSRGKKIPLTLSTEYMGVRLSHKGASQSLESRYPQIAGSGDAGTPIKDSFYLFKLKDSPPTREVEQLSSSLRSDASVDMVAPVFKAGGAHMMVTDEFIVQFAQTVPESDILALNARNGVEIVEKAGWAENTYILRTTSGDALSMANTYHDIEGVIYSHPNFIRIRKSLPESKAPSGADPKSKTIIGPDGKVLPSVTSIGKGSTSYRVTEPVSAKLDNFGGPDLQSGYLSATNNNTMIRSDGFEGGFPSEWTTIGSPTWSATTYRAFSGSWSAYCVGSTVSPPGPYPENVGAAMVYGPFSLADARNARVNLRAWINSESGYDRLSTLASTDGTQFYGYGWSGNWTTDGDANGWIDIPFDLTAVPTIGNLTGQSSVWVALRFASDDSITKEGAYVDDVQVQKITGYTDLTSDTYSYLQWSLANNGQLWGTSGIDIDVADAWNTSTGSNITIAIIDEGVDLTHPDLKDKMVTGYDATGNNSAGAPSGNDAHGTACAGIASASTANGTGVAGVARDSKIMPVRIAYEDASGNWVTTDSQIADGITWAVNNGADVLSNSWGGGTSSDTVTNAISYALSSGRSGSGSVVVFAAGNDNGASLEYPANIEGVIAVGAMSPCGERKSPSSCDGEYYWGSDYGQGLAVLAPGVSMTTTDIQGAAGYNSGDYLTDFNGTSSATPMVAGVAALVLGARSDLTASQVATIIKNSADDLGKSGWDSETGFGKVNAYTSVISVNGPIASLWQSWFAVDSRETPMVGDFNGDGKTDIITFTRDNPNAVGDVYVALSDGDNFGTSTKWNDWFAVNKDELVVIGDFNGDHVDDIATWLSTTTKQVYVALSYGSGMSNSTVWVNSIGDNSDDVLKSADVDGDGKADLVLFSRHTGKVYVALSTGGGFSAPQVWHNFFAVSTYEQPDVGDVDGDGMADIITFCKNSPTAQGDVYVALSTGSQFGDGQGSSKWNDWFSVESTQKVRIGDVNGDGRADFFTFMTPPNGQVYVSYSEGTTMSNSVLWVQSFAPYESDVPYAGDVDGDGKADLVLFRQSEGKVYVSMAP